MCTATASFDSPSFVTPDDLKVAASELPPSPQVLESSENCSATRTLGSTISPSLLTLTLLSRLGFLNSATAPPRQLSRRCYKSHRISRSLQIGRGCPPLQTCFPYRIGPIKFRNAIMGKRIGLRPSYGPARGQSRLRRAGHVHARCCDPSAKWQSISAYLKKETLHASLPNSCPCWNGKPVRWESPTQRSLALASWNFSDSTIQSIQLQYLDSDQKRSGESLLLNLACFIVEKIDKGLPGESGYWRPVFYCERLLQVNDLKHVRGSVRERRRNPAKHQRLSSALSLDSSSSDSSESIADPSSSEA